MAFKRFAGVAFFGAVLGFAGSHTAMAQQYTRWTPAITAPAPGASVPSPVTVAYGLADAQAVPPATGHHHRMPHAFLVIDSATPVAGSQLQPDADHVAFPAGQRQLSIPLPPGHHALQVVFVNRQGRVAIHVPPSAVVSISVQ
jgi:hypothetical protein